MADTPFDEIVKITWDLSSPTNGLVELINATRRLDTALANNLQNVSSWALGFTNRIGLIHDAFRGLIGDINEMEARMSGSVASAIVSQSTRANDRSPFGFPTTTRAADPPGAWAQTNAYSPYDNRMQVGYGMAPQQAMMGMVGGTGFGFPPPGSGAVFPGSGAGYPPGDDRPFGFVSGPPPRRAPPLDLGHLTDAENEELAYYQEMYGTGSLARGRTFASAESSNTPEIRAQNQALGDIGADVQDQIRLEELKYRNYTLGTTPEQMAQARGLGEVGADVEEQIRVEELKFRNQQALGATMNQAMNAQLAGPMSTSGLSGPALAGALQQNLGVAQGAMAQALQASLQSGGAPAQQAAYQAAAQNVQALQQQIAGLNQVATNSPNAMARHISSIIHTIAIYQALHLAVQTARQAIEQAMIVQSTAARAGFISGQGDSFTQGEFMRAAQYGVTPQQAGPGIIAGAQTGADASTREAARQAALVFGADQYVNAIQEIQQTEIRASAAGIAHVDTMNYLAEAYKRVPLSMEEYFDSLQFGIELQNTLQLSAEESGLAILNITKATEQSPTQVANILERVRLRLDPETPTGEETAKRLSGFGIAAGDPATMMREIATQVAGAARSGDTARSDAILQALVGGLAGPQTLRELRIVFVSLFDSFQKAQPQLASWNSLVTDIGSTGEQSFKRLKASWDLLLASLANIGPITKAADYMAEAFNARTVINNNLSEFNSLTDAERQQLIDDYKTKTGIQVTSQIGLAGGYQPDVAVTPDMASKNGLVGDFFKDPAGFIRDFVAREDLSVSESAKFLLFMQEQLHGSQGGPPPAWMTSAGPSAPLTGKGMLTAPAPSQFGGFQEFPEGANWEKFLADIDKYEAQLKKEVPGYTVNPMEVAFWDTSTGHYRRADGDAEAMRRALNDQTQTLKQIQGVFNVPAGGEVQVPFFALTSGMYPSNRVPAGGLGFSDNGSGLLDDKHAGRIRPSRSAPSGTRGPMPFDPGVGGSGLLYGEGDERNRSRMLDRGVASSGLLYGEGDGPGRARQGAQGGEMRGIVVPVTIHTRNIIVLNGRMIHEEMLTQMQRELSGQRRGFGSGSGASYMAA